MPKEIGVGSGVVGPASPDCRKCNQSSPPPDILRSPLQWPREPRACCRVPQLLAACFLPRKDRVEVHIVVGRVFARKTHEWFLAALASETERRCANRWFGGTAMRTGSRTNSSKRRSWNSPRLERMNNECQLQSSITQACQKFVVTPIVQLHVNIRHCLLERAQSRRHDLRRG